MQRVSTSVLFIITVPVDMNLIVVCNHEVTAIKEDESDNERIIKILDLNAGWCRLLMLFWRSLSRHITLCTVLVEPVARIGDILLREATLIPD